MPVAGLVLTTAPGSAEQTSLEACLRADPRLTVGEWASGCRLPLVTETQTLEEQSLLWQSMVSLPGVVSLDLAFQDFSDIENVHSSELVPNWMGRARK